MTSTPTPYSRDRGIATVRRLTVGGALAGMTLTGALTGALARADAAAVPTAAEQPESAASTAVAPAMPRRTVIIIGGAPAQRAGSAPATTTRQRSRGTGPAPAVRAPQQAAPPAARSTGSGPG